MSRNIVDTKYIDDNLTCGICQCVLEDPYRPVSCKHVFCKTCLYNSSVVSQACPICRVRFNIRDIVADTKIRNLINSSKYVCNDCDQTINVSNMNSHNMKCTQVVTPKPSYIQPSQRIKTEPTTTSSLRGQPSNVANRYTFKCPYCPQANLTLDALRGHCNQFHVNDTKNKVCPVCSVMPWGDPNLESIDLIGHLNLRHKFEYEKFVDFEIDDDEMLRRACKDSLILADNSYKRNVASLKASR